MKVRDLIEELQCFDSEARVFILDGDGDNVEVEHLFRIKEDKPVHKQDVLLTERF